MTRPDTPSPSPEQHAAPQAAGAARRKRPPIVGLAGGIGSGKSAVARILAQRGAVVSDSDAQARALLRERGIADILTRWWGTSILGADKLPDRASVAALVFADATQRKRLEGLIHPILHSQRRAAILAASKTHPQTPLFVIDAPLLFEAGLDKECDAVIFVDAPRSTRLARVAASRGWDENQLARREAAQLPLDAKRKRSAFVIENADLPFGLGEAPPGHLKRQIDEIWPKLLALRSTRRRRA